MRLASRFPKARLAKTWNEHTATGAHRSRRIPFPGWVPTEVKAQAARLSVAEAEAHPVGDGPLATAYPVG